MAVVMAPSSLDELSACIRDAGAARRTLRIRGGGTKDWLGERLEGEVLDVGDYRGIVEYEPSELVVIARCGTPIAEVEAALAQRGQMIAFEPPHFGEAATVGGVIAAGLAGPRRAAYGTAAGGARDFVLGVRLIDGRGDVLRFGGTVMKNVAGYDVSRLLAGSFGILGVLADVTLKVLPRPLVEVTLTFDLDEAAALDTINTWASKPLPVSATAWCSGVLAVRLSGSEAAVRAAVATLGGDQLDATQAHAYWNGVREQTDAFFSAADHGGGLPLWRLSVPSLAPPVGIEGDQFIEWNGALRWLRTRATAEQVRQACARVHGSATLWRAHGDHSGVARSTPPPSALMAIHRRLKTEFDPHNIFNRGRLFADL